MNKEQAKIAIEIVREAMNRINPYNLLEDGNDDELDSEIMSITSQLQRCGSGRDVAHAFCRVLNSAFNEKDEPELYFKEGEIIYKALKENGIK